MNKKATFHHKNTIIINFENRYFKSSNDLLSSHFFKNFINQYIEHLKESNNYLFAWLDKNKTKSNIVDDIVYVAKQLSVLSLDEIDHAYTDDCLTLNSLVEDIYIYWRKMNRYTMSTGNNKKGYTYTKFIDADNAFNNLVLNTYRSIQERIQGCENHVYRELNSGSNGSFLVSNFAWDCPSEYKAIKNIGFINKILLRTPMIISTESNKRKGTFTQVDVSPLKDFKFNEEEWFCLPVKAGNLLTFFYFNFKHISNALALANLFSIASSEECINHKPGAIVLFGVEDNNQDTTFYYDKANEIWVGKVSDDKPVDYFGYNKKMILTLYNLHNMSKGYLPIHGSMIKLYFKNGKQKNVVFMGDSGTGKSETIEALTKVGKEYLSHYDVIFDDMGYMRINDKKEIVASGSEIGAFIRLDDLDQSVIYSDMDRAIFFNPECVNSRVVIPISKYETITAEHKVDLFLYANNYTDKIGINLFKDANEAKPVFVEGKRMAMQTTQEVGISKTYFANPFGPMQKQDLCQPIIDEVFAQAYKNKLSIGEIYTCLGLENKEDKQIQQSALELLRLVNADK